MEEYIDKVLADIKKDLSSQNPPKVVYDPKTKKISVTCDFAFGQIKNVKLMSSCKIWLILFYGLNFERLTFNQIAPLLSRNTSKEKKESLKNYSKLKPAEYGGDVVKCFLAILSENRKYQARKIPRKQPILDWHHRNIISKMAADLYVYLTRISKKSKPDYLLRCFKFVKNSDGEGLIDIETQLGRQDAVRRLLSVYYRYPFGDRFFQTFVTDPPIKLSLIKKSNRISPANNPFLKSLFEKFI